MTMSNIEIEKIRPTTSSRGETEGRPTIIPWKDQRIIRPQSIQAAVFEIVQKSLNRDVIKVAIVGEPDTGKTTQADTIAHIFHKLMKKRYNIDFAVRSYDKTAFLNIKETLAELGKNPTNYILKFGDLSFLKATFGSKKIAELEQALTEIRHLPGGRDVKIVIIYDYHYSKALPPYVRQSDFKYFTGIGGEEKKNMGELVGQQYFAKMIRFKKLSDQAPSTGKFTYRLGNKGHFTYDYRNPFIPMLFWNEIRLRDVVSPTREWIDPFCTVCSMNTTHEAETLNSERIIEVGTRKFPPAVFDQAIKLKMHSMGINMYSPRVQQCERWFEKVMDSGNTDLHEIAAKRGLAAIRTKLFKTIDGIADKPAKDLNPDDANQ